jgi:hypothetical protein
MHGLSSGDTVYITGIADTTPTALGYNGVPASYLNGTHSITRVDDDTITFSLVGITPNRSGNLFVLEVPDLLNITPTNTLSAIAHATANGQTAAPPFADPTIMAPATLNGSSAQLMSQPTPPTLTSSSRFTIYTNVTFNECMVDYIGTEFTDTEIQENIYATTATSTSGTEVAYTAPTNIELPQRKDFHSFDEPHMLATPSNETAHTPGTTGTYKSFAANIKMTTTNKDVSPIIDMDGMAVTVRSYKIDNQSGEIDSIKSYITANPSTSKEDAYNNATTNSEIAPGKGKAAAKYKSTVNNLGSTFNDLELFVTGNCPSPAVIDAYIRASTDLDTHGDRNWIWAPIEGSYDNTFTSSPNKSTMNQWIFKVPQSISTPFTIAQADVATATGIITINNHGLVTGNAIVYYNRGGASITNLTDGTTYYVIRDGSNTIKLATTAANAAAGTFQTLGSAGDNNQQLLPQIGLGNFTIFDVKLVMRSTNNSIVPKIYSVRAIANNV